MGIKKKREIPYGDKAGKSAGKLFVAGVAGNMKNVGWMTEGGNRHSNNLKL